VELRTSKKIDNTAQTYINFSDEELARLVTQADEAALSMLYDRYSKQALGLAYRIIGQLELAEEVAQEAFLRFWERPNLYDSSRSRFAGWLLSVVHHRAINERQRSAFRLNISAEGAGGNEGTLLDFISIDEPEPHELVWMQTQREAIRHALLQLTHPQRQVIELAYFNGLNQREIAQQLDEPLGTIKTRTRQAMQKLRTILNAEGHGLNQELTA
jgi:RNA polymerase sigma-70 factor (ECF subfamily)